MDSLKTNQNKSGFANLELFLDDVDEKLRAFSQKAETAAGTAQLKTHLGLLEAEEFWTKRKADLLKVIGRLKEAQAKPLAALEEGRIELFFGKADAKEALGDLRQRLERTEQSLRELGQEANADAKVALQRLTDAYQAIKEKLLH
jgi:hypothetical protein